MAVPHEPIVSHRDIVRSPKLPTSVSAGPLTKFAFRVGLTSRMLLQAIEEAIERGLPRVEAGAQGEHKIQRGYLPSLTHSVHYIRDPEFKMAVQQVLLRSRNTIRSSTLWQAPCSTRPGAFCGVMAPVPLPYCSRGRRALCVPRLSAPHVAVWVRRHCNEHVHRLIADFYICTCMQFLRRETHNIDFTLEALTNEASPYKSLT